jgi:hypothetical protein
VILWLINRTQNPESKIKYKKFLLETWLLGNNAAARRRIR